MTSKTTNRFSREVRTRAVRLVLEHEGEHQDYTRVLYFFKRWFRGTDFRF